MKRAVAAALALVAVLVAGCDSQEPPPSVLPPSAPSAGPLGMPGSPGSAGKMVRGCDLITRPDIARLTGATDITPSAQDGKGSAGCVYSDTGKKLTLILLAYNYPAAQFGDPRRALESSMAGGPPPRQISGVGDVAEFSGDPKSATLAAVKKVNDNLRVTVLRGTSGTGLPWSNVLSELGRTVLRALG